MKSLFPILLLLGVFLYMDRFLFRGRLARLLVQGWREMLRLQHKEVLPPAASGTSEPAAEGLVLRKEYAEGFERQTGEQSREREPTIAGSSTFTSATEASGQNEVLEWHDPSYFSDLPTPQSPSAGAETMTPHWDDEDFAITDFGNESEKIRREVAASLEDWRIEEARIELEMSAEEVSDIEAFDMDAYQ